jgi:ferredoxin
MCVKIHFISPDGETTQTVEAKAGDNLLDVAQRAGQPLEGTCEGQMACSASGDEEDMLDLASGARRTSRLSCQVELSAEFDGLIVHIPSESRNMQGV